MSGARCLSWSSNLRIVQSDGAIALPAPLGRCKYSTTTELGLRHAYMLWSNRNVRFLLWRGRWLCSELAPQRLHNGGGRIRLFGPGKETEDDAEFVSGRHHTGFNVAVTAHLLQTNVGHQAVAQAFASGSLFENPALGNIEVLWFGGAAIGNSSALGAIGFAQDANVAETGAALVNLRL